MIDCARARPLAKLEKQVKDLEKFARLGRRRRRRLIINELELTLESHTHTHTHTHTHNGLT